jgi:hypothetical protein
MKKLAAAVLLVLAACSKGNSVVVVELSLADPTIALTTVEVTATPSSGAAVTRSFSWADARNDVLSAGLYLPADVQGPVALRAAGMDATSAVEATGTAQVSPGKVSDTVSLPLHRTGAPPINPDGGVPPDASNPGAEAGDLAGDTGQPPPDASAPGEMGAPPPDTALPLDAGPPEPPSLTRCVVYEHAGACELTPVTLGVGVWDIRFSPDGNYLVSGGGDGNAKIWKVMGGALVDEKRTIATGTAVVSPRLAFSRDGSRLAIGGGDGVISVYEFPRGTLATTITVDSSGVGYIAFSGDGSRLVSLDNARMLKVWDVATAKEVRSTTLSTDFYGATLSPASSATSLWIAVSLAKTSSFSLLDLAAPDPLPVINATTPADVFAQAFSPDGRQLVVSPTELGVGLWDVSNKQTPVMGAQLLPGGGPTPVDAVFFPDGRFVALAGSSGEHGAGTIKIAALQAPVLRGNYNTPSSVVSIDVSPDGRAVAGGSWRCGKITYCRD